MGSSYGMAFMIRVTESGLSGLTKAYTSVRSAYGSPAIMGASRWLEALVASGVTSVPTSKPAEATAVPTTERGCFIVGNAPLLCSGERATESFARVVSYLRIGSRLMCAARLRAKASAPREQAAPDLDSDRGSRDPACRSAADQVRGDARDHPRRHGARVHHQRAPEPAKHSGRGGDVLHRPGAHARQAHLSAV